LSGAEGGTALFGSSSRAASASLQPVFKFNTPSKTKSIEGAITLVIGGDSFQTYPSKPLKTVFNEYADKHSVSLKTLRFSYAGKTLFLSTVGNKSPDKLGMIDHDSIEVHPVEVISPTPTNDTLKFQETNNSVTQKQKKKARGKSNKCKKGTYRLKVKKSDEEYKEHHSLKLTKLHEEAAPKFKEIRQQLDALLLFKQQPKTKVQSKSLSNQAYSDATFNPTPEGLGGKAGKTHFVLNVGDVNNLYKSSKSNHHVSSTPSTLDLHGCSQAEAISKLNAGLENWNNRAMTGSYPFIHTVSIICGAGGQVLSEVVEKWIKEKPNVCNAPKMKMTRCKFPSVA
jgi:DNA-nicking Smr family endonuclease